MPDLFYGEPAVEGHTDSQTEEWYRAHAFEVGDAAENLYGKIGLCIVSGIV